MRPVMALDDNEPRSPEVVSLSRLPRGIALQPVRARQPRCDRGHAYLHCLRQGIPDYRRYSPLRAARELCVGVRPGMDAARPHPVRRLLRPAGVGTEILLPDPLAPGPQRRVDPGSGQRLRKVHRPGSQHRRDGGVARLQLRRGSELRDERRPPQRPDRSGRYLCDAVAPRHLRPRILLWHVAGHARPGRGLCRPAACAARRRCALRRHLQGHTVSRVPAYQVLRTAVYATHEPRTAVPRRVRLGGLYVAAGIADPSTAEGLPL